MNTTIEVINKIGIIISNWSLFSYPIKRKEKRIIIEISPERPSKPSIRLNAFVNATKANKVNKIEI